MDVKEKERETNLSWRSDVSRLGGCIGVYLVADTPHYFQQFYLATRLSFGETSRSDERLESMLPPLLHLSVTRIRRLSIACFFQTLREILVVIAIYARCGEISFENSL